MTLAKRISLSLSTCIFLCASSIRAIDLPEKDDSIPLEWWQEEIVYQVYPRSHQDTDGDGVGDIKGIENRLDHFVDLGVGSVWISPIYKSPMIDFGYDIANFTDIEPIFGTMESFRNMSRAMKERGIKLTMDSVPNHSSNQHPWFNMSIEGIPPYKDYYVWKDPKGRDDDGNPIPPNNWRSVFGRSAWEWNDKRQQFYYHQFTKEQPDFDFRNRNVVLEMLGVFKFWLDMGVDGFRVDAVPHLFEHIDFEDNPANPNPPPDANCQIDYACLLPEKTYNLPENLDVLAQFRQLMDVYTLSDGSPRVMMIECTVQVPELFEYYGTKERPIAHYPFNFEFIDHIHLGFNGNDLHNRLDLWFTGPPDGSTPNWLLGNHDNKRAATRYTPARVDALNMINLLLPGSAVTYYGEEIGMLNANISWEDTVDPPGCDAGKDRYEQFSRDPERTPMQWNGREKNAGFSDADRTWLPMHPNWQELNVEAQWGSESLTHLKVYKRIAQLRKTDIWRYGSMESKPLQNGDLYGFARILEGKGFVYVANFANSPRTVNLMENFRNIPAMADVYLTSIGFIPDTALDAPRSTIDVQIYPDHAIIMQWG